jgi:arylsulfatase A-like enzyme
MKVTFKFLIYTCLIFGSTFTVCGQYDRSRPNVIYINVDDLGWKDVGYMGSTYYETPNIDKLAAQGMVFTQGYASASNCAPSRACLLSGQNTPRHGIYTVGSSARGNIKTRKLIPISNTKHLKNEMVTLAEMFKIAGYTTGTFGKWHVSTNPLYDGFDVNIGGNHKGNPGKNGYVAPYNGLPNLESAPIGENLTDRLTNEAITFVQDNKENPFFLYLPFYAVHTPLMGKASLIEKYKLKGGKDGQDNPVFAAMVENVDSNIGRLLEMIDTLNLKDNTIVIFTSDNGGIRAISRQDPLRAGKGSYYEGGIRVPYIIKWPGVIQENATNNSPIINMDFFPTFMEITGVAIPDKILDGRSILSLLKGENILERPLYWHYPIYLEAYNMQKDDGRDPLFRTRPGSTILFNNWKLHQFYEDGGIELYNLKNDIGERNNVAKSNPEISTKLLTLLNQWRTSLKAPIPSTINPVYDPEYVPKRSKK